MINMKKIIFSVIIILIVLIIANKISKQFLSQTKFERVDRIENLKVIYGNEFEDYVDVYINQSNAMIYEPLTEFKEKPKNSKFVSVSELGNRCIKINLKNCEPAKGGENEIWIFGGSTVFGYGLKNNETIAAYLNELIKDKRVINFGQGYYNSNQSRIYFQNLLTFLPKPHTAIFLEGFNDFKNNQINNYKSPTKTALSNSYYILINNREISTNEKILKWFKERFNRLNFVRLIKQIRKNKSVNTDSDSIKITINNLEEAYNTLVNRLMTNFTINKSIGEKFEIKILNILEPIALSKDRYSSSSLPVSYLKNFEKDVFHYKKIYEIIENNDNFLNLIDLYLVNLNIDEKMFVDKTHFSKNLSKEIAFKIYKKLNM
tara:strand:+ start:1354 stop:2478 length:1125 start_codon:yes stop_codon:yes gene_type:complete